MVSQTKQSRNDIPSCVAERSRRDARIMKYETLLTDLADGVMTVTLNRPDKLNAFNPAMSRELIDFFQRVNAMDEVRAIVVTGAGRAFCAGADISGGSGAFQVWNDGNHAAETRGERFDHARDLQLPEADRGGDQWRGRGCRHHHVPAHGHPPDLECGQDRFRLQQARHGDGSRKLLVPAAPRRHAASPGMGDDGRTVRRRRSA